MTTIAGLLTAVTAAALLGIALGALVAPAALRSFLLSFAKSARAHYIEMTIRLAAGAAFVLYSPHMAFANGFYVFGWLLIVTTTGLLLLPWQWHRRFAESVVPAVIRFLPVYGAGSLALSALILYALLQPRW